MAKDKEKLTTLDEIERELTENDIVISDGNKVIGLAGVMGGLDTEISENTKNVIIESAIFDGVKVRLTSKKIVRSEASNRFEKGLDPNRTYMGVERACTMLEKYANAKILSGTAIYDKTDKKDKEIKITLENINNILGSNLTLDEVIDIFRRLGFKTKIENKTITVIVPTRRLDVNIKEDLIEEVRTYIWSKLHTRKIAKSPYNSRKIQCRIKKYEKQNGSTRTKRNITIYINKR